MPAEEIETHTNCRRRPCCLWLVARWPLLAMVVGTLGCTVFTDTEIPTSPESTVDLARDDESVDVPDIADVNELDSELVGDISVDSVDLEVFDLDVAETTRLSVAVEIDGDPDPNWRLAVFHFVGDEGQLQLVDEHVSIPLSGTEVDLEVPVPDVEDLGPIPFDETGTGALFLIATYIDSDLDGIQADGELLVGSSQQMLGYLSDDGGPTGTWLAVDPSTEGETAIIPIPERFAVVTMKSLTNVEVIATIADADPRADRIATVSRWELESGLLPDRLVDEELSAVATFNLPSQLPTDRLGGENDSLVAGEDPFCGGETMGLV